MNLEETIFTSPNIKAKRTPKPKPEVRMTQHAKKPIPFKAAWETMRPIPQIKYVADCCGILQVSPWYFKGYELVDNMQYPLAYGDTFHPEQVASYIEYFLKEYKKKARKLIVVLNNPQNKKIGQVFLDYGFTLIPSLSDIKNPNTNYLLWTYEIDLI